MMDDEEGSGGGGRVLYWGICGGAGVGGGVGAVDETGDQGIGLQLEAAEVGDYLGCCIIVPVVDDDAGRDIPRRPIHQAFEASLG